MRAVEFYSGLGGLHYALKQAVPDAEVVMAFDINDTANDVYEHNFGVRPSQTNIDSLTAARLDKLRADLWLLSPPCQPYTRRGLRLQSSDGRATSFLTLLGRLVEMRAPPSSLLLENVVGFEVSDTCAAMLCTLRGLGYAVQEVLASPTDLGIPYSRPRYFALAQRGSGELSTPQALPFAAVREDRSAVALCAPPPACHPLADFLEADPLAELAGGVRLKLPNNIHFKRRSGGDDEDGVAAPGIGGTPDPHAVTQAPAGPLAVPPPTLLAHGWCMDLVTADSTRTCCFTKTYGQYIKGSGSVLAAADADSVCSVVQSFPCLERGGSKGEKQEAPCAPELAAALGTLGLRFFSPREIANLHGFPPGFAFPLAITLRQRYALLGNSLHVGVVAALLHHLLSLAPTAG